MIKYGPPEKVYVEGEWYDGPRSGIADINGVPHRFTSLFDEADGEYLGTFVVWPVNEVSLALEIEQWQIFVEWNSLYESGMANTQSHPGNGGVNPRWDEIEALLKQCRSEVPANAKKALAVLESLNRDLRYEFCGPDYMLRRCLL
jgi:hypothetical protein